MFKEYFILLALLVVSFPNRLAAQPTPCIDPPAMTSFCADACIICDIDGFTGRHESTIQGEVPPKFAGECTIIAHNMQWIAFIAGSIDLKVALSVSNCDMGQGLEFGLYKGIDCDNFERISNCFGGMNTISPGESGTIINSEPLAIGQFYYIVMDGGFGDNCDWTFNVVEGSTRVSPLETSGPIEGVFESCPNVENIYTANIPVGATEIKWELDGVDLQTTATEIPLSFDFSGSYTLCVTVSNACEEAPPTCQEIAITNIPPTNFEEKICEGDIFEVADTLLRTAGNYEFHITTNEGCDSVIFVNLETIPAAFTDLGTINICEGDTLPIGVDFFTERGNHSTVLLNEIGCDSTISLDLLVVICNIEGQIKANRVVCNGEASGSLDFSVLNGTPPFTYTWESLGGLLTGNGSIAELNTNETINNLIAGTYLVTIKDDFGNQRILIEEVSEPEVFSFSTESSNYNDFNISCFEGTDGTITVFPEGGSIPYNYLWEDGETINNRTNLIAGEYPLTITDVGGCILETIITLEQPMDLIFRVDFIDPNCNGLTTGSVETIEIDGGVPPYFYKLNETGFSNNAIFENLTEGTYSITVEDANGCKMEQIGELIAPSIPTLILGEDITIELSEAIDLMPEVVTNANSASWRNDAGLSCYDCFNTNATPANLTTYKLTVSSVDGCTAMDSINVSVLKIRDVYVPNIFSPNQDGINDQLIIHAGPEVNSIISFQVYSRWGELLFEKEHFSPNDINFGWKGDMDGKMMNNGVFVWVAKIDFIDGETLIYSGDVVLTR